MTFSDFRRFKEWADLEWYVVHEMDSSVNEVNAFHVGNAVKFYCREDTGDLIQASLEVGSKSPQPLRGYEQMLLDACAKEAVRRKLQERGVTSPPEVA